MTIMHKGVFGYGQDVESAIADAVRKLSVAR